MIVSKTKTFSLLILFSLILLSVKAQTPVSINGKVSNEKGEPLEGVSVMIKSTKQGTVTDAKGNFHLNVPANTLLTVSLVGYDSMSVAARPQLQLVLSGADHTLNDVVVIGYGTQKRKELTGSIATVGSKDFQKGAITTAEQLIAGKIAGVSITSDGGAPGAMNRIRIRGGASLNASNDPLIVIDGIPLSGNNIYGASNPLSLINPNDIETFTVLKDAAATAIYGSRASNGVIIITTKKGSGKKPTISFNTQISVATLAKKMDIQSADDFRKYVDSLGNGTFDNVHTYKSLMGTASTDWQDEIFHNAISTDNNLSVAGSVKKIPYRVSMGYLNQDGILKTDNLQRFSGGISISPKFLNDHLKVDINLKGAVNRTRFANGGAISNAVYFDPTQPVHATSPFGDYYEWYSTDPNTNEVTLNKLAPRNPVAMIDLYRNISHVRRSYGNIQLDYSFPFLPELHANLNLGYDIAKGEGTIDVPAYAAQNFLDGGQKNKYANKIGNKVSEFYFNYVKDLKKIKSNINLTVGYGYYNNHSTNYNYATLKANGDTTRKADPNATPQNTILSYYGRLIYTLNNRYILAASLRTDASSKFASSDRWGTFPSIAFTWRINQEKFLASSKVLSDLKLRLSYGVTGNQDGIKDYPYQAVYGLSTTGSAVQFGNTFYYMGTPAAYDEHIKWEQTAATNLGLDFGFMKNRLSGSFDYYYKKTKDLLNITPIPLGSNFDSRILTNIGNDENSGIELTLNAQIIKNPKYSWTLSVNGAYNKNKVTNLTATNDPSFKGSLTGDGRIQINTVGYELNSFYVFKQEYNANGKPIEGVYADLNNDGVINQDDLYHYKSPYPKYIFGLSSQFNYGKWTLSTVLRANVGNYAYNGVATGAVKANVFNPLGYLANGLTDLTNTYFTNSQYQSDYYIQNASFLKMDNLGLGFNAGKIMHNKISLQVNANCQNVFTITKYKGLDPEVFGGIDNTIYPRPRTFVLGINLQY